MTLKKVCDNRNLTITLEGWLDNFTSPDLGRELELISDIDKLILDFEKLEYISSAGLRQIAFAGKKVKAIGADFEIINVGQEVMSVLKLTGFDKKFKIAAK